MTATTPRGFRDILPSEALWRASIRRAIEDRFFAWGYSPVQTPTLETLEVFEGSGALDDTPFRFYDSDNNLLALRPDVTLPVARLVATRMCGQEAPFRLSYTLPVFREKETLRAQDREFTQAGIECIGPSGVAADAEVLCLLFEALEAAGLDDFTVAVGTVGVLNALVEAATDDEGWRLEVLDAFHRSDFVALDELCVDGRAATDYAEAIAKLARINGGREALAACRDLVEPLGCLDGLEDLERTFDLVSAHTSAGTLLVDFSIISSIGYYTGLVFKAYAPHSGLSLGSGGRYDSTLKDFGRDEAAAGFAVGIERIMQALEAEGKAPAEPDPIESVDGGSLEERFSSAAQLRAQGKRAVIGGGSDE